MAGEKAHHERCGGHGHAHTAHSDVAAMIDRARAFAAARKLPFTEMRARVLTVLAQEEKPLTAYELVDRLSVPKIVQAVQVYRALDFLQEAGCVHRLASKASYFACDHEHHPGEAVVFMVCSHCGTVQEAPSDLVAQGLQGAAEHAGFKPAHPIVELEGECARCSETKAA
ncbi:MAG: Fur family transcriptional regulator [Aestuariivirga sp.]|uniref:Fur family transcriptional regulator n=1 Tax=Aestuariivirga sp. TaxID=2650926 RepID=UPI0038D15CD1